MATTNKSPKVTYLKDYLQRIGNEKAVFSWRDQTEVKLIKPLAVIVAEKRLEQDSKIVAAFQKKVEIEQKKISDQKKTTYRRCEREIFFGDPATALRMLDAFAAMKFE